MSITDKLTGRLKQAAGDLLGDRSLHREGREEERKGNVKDELRAEEAAELREEARAEQRVARQREQTDRKAAELADLERRT
jgi:uncharacterized protein YjbJ (UPF0337 family)